MNATTTKLSVQQKRQLVWLYAMTLDLYAEGRGGFGPGVYRGGGLGSGVCMPGFTTWARRYLNDNADWSRSEASSWSRTWRRLEHRGLVERYGDVRGLDEGGRITGVALTAQGVQAALQIIDANANRPWIHEMLNGCQSSMPATDNRFLKQWKDVQLAAAM